MKKEHKMAPELYSISFLIKTIKFGLLNRQIDLFLYLMDIIYLLNTIFMKQLTVLI